MPTVVFHLFLTKLRWLRNEIFPSKERVEIVGLCFFFAENEREIYFLWESE